MSQQEDVPDDEEKWKEILTDEEYRVLREGGTEPRFSGDLLDNDGEGTYTCAGCGAELFHSGEKFDSGTGWPSFWDAYDEGNVETRVDSSHGMRRTEVVCARLAENPVLLVCQDFAPLLLCLGDGPLLAHSHR